MIKILLVLPFYGGSLPIGRYCAEGLKECGCIVEVFESPDFYTAFGALKELKLSSERLDFLESNFLQLISQSILAKAEAFRPDLVLCMAQAPMSRKALAQLREEGILSAMWFVEDFRLFTYWRSFAQYYDVFAVIQKDPFLGLLKDIGQKNTLYLPLAALPSLHKKMSLSSEEEQEFSADLSFLGAGYPNRRVAFKEIARANFKIWGTEWDGEPALVPYIQREGARISSEEAVKIYSATKINLNLHSGISADLMVTKGDFVNPRTFELACAEAFQLVDQRSLMAELFEADELETFTSMDILKEKIDYFLNNPHEKEELIKKSQARVLAEHQYKHRMQTLLDYLATCFSDFGQKKEPEIYASLPEEMRSLIKGFLKESGLPLDASFNDVIGALRAKSGKLSEMETALLFLDEWKKQYKA